MKNNEFAKQNVYIIPVVAIVSAAAVAMTLIITKYNSGYNKLDKFTYCLQTIIESSHKVGKTVDADKAKEICSELKR